MSGTADYKKFEFRNITLNSKAFAKYQQSLTRDTTSKDTVVPWLGLRVNPKGALSFETTYRVKAGRHKGKQRRMSLGRYPADLDIKAARVTGSKHT